MALEGPPPDLLQAQAPSKTSTLISLVLLVLSVGFATAGQLTLKAAMNEVGRIGTAEVSDAGSTLLRAAKEPNLWLGLVLFGVSSLFWLVVLSRVDLSLAYPMVGFSYVVIVVLAALVLDENVPPLRWAGVLIIAVGIALIGISSRTVSGS
ncbi:MAG: EamA family transporter [Actinobacteria bacterium]|nr:EamA family transporter [Actinomycetota bacterium]